MATGGEPVYLKNGEQSFSSQDLFIQGRVLPIKIARTYGSRRHRVSRFGYNWDMSYNIGAYKFDDDPNTFVVLDGENRALEYSNIGSSDPGKFAAPAGYYDYLVEHQDGTCTIYKKFGDKVHFDAYGNVSEIRDRHGNSITFAYDVNEFLTKITDDLGRDIDLSYDSNDMLSVITDFASRQWTYTYDANDDLVEVTSPNSPEHPNGLTKTYTYDANHNIRTITDANGQTFFTNTYDTNDMVTQQMWGNGTFKFAYFPDNNETLVTGPKDVNELTVYNSTGHPLSITVYTKDPCDDPNSFTTSYKYNSDMEVTKEIFPAGNYIDYWYDPNGNLLKISREPNDCEPNIVTSYTYEPHFNFVKTITAPDGNVTTYDYDEDDALSFDGAGDYVQVSDDDSLTDLSGLTMSAWIYLNSISNDRSGIIQKYYAVSGNRAYLMELGKNNDGTDNSTVAIGVSQTGAPFNGKFTFGTTQLQVGQWYHIVTTWEADHQEVYVNGIEETDDTDSAIANSMPNNNEPLYIGYEKDEGTYFNGTIDDVRVYNKALSENEIEALYYGEGDNNDLVGYWKMDDNADNTTVVDSSGNNNNGTSVRNTSAMHTTRTRGKLVKITYPMVTLPDGNQAAPTVSFTYNRYSQIQTVTAPDGIVTKYEYYSDVNDANNYGRPWKVIVDYNETDGLNITTEYEYDVLGRVIEANDPNGYKTKLAYNALDLLTKITDPCGNVTNLSYNDVKKLSQIERERTNDPNQIMSFTYNILDRLETLTDPCNYVTEFSYDASENLSDVNDAEENNTKYEYDERNLLWKVTDANGNVTEYGYNANGKLADINDAKGNVTSYHYDGFDRLIKISYPNDSNEKFSYDKNSNVTSWENRKDETINYEYDALNRLIVKNRPGPQYYIPL